MSIGIQILGAKALAKEMKRARNRVACGLAAAIYQKGLQIMADSNEIVPVKDGRLKGSQYVAPPKDIFDPVVELGYGTKYALYVHEMTQSGVTWTRSGSGAKYLERPLKKHKRGYRRWIKKKAWENYKRGICFGNVRASAPKQPKEARD